MKYHMTHLKWVILSAFILFENKPCAIVFAKLIFNSGVINFFSKIKPLLIRIQLPYRNLLPYVIENCLSIQHPLIGYTDVIHPSTSAEWPLPKNFLGSVKYLGGGCKLVVDAFNPINSRIIAILSCHVQSAYVRSIQCGKLLLIHPCPYFSLPFPLPSTD